MSAREGFELTVRVSGLEDTDTLLSIFYEKGDKTRQIKKKIMQKIYSLIDDVSDAQQLYIRALLNNGDELTDADCTFSILLDMEVLPCILGRLPQMTRKECYDKITSLSEQMTISQEKLLKLNDAYDDLKINYEYISKAYFETKKLYDEKSNEIEKETSLIKRTEDEIDRLLKMVDILESKKGGARKKSKSKSKSKRHSKRHSKK